MAESPGNLIARSSEANKKRTLNGTANVPEKAVELARQ